MKEFKSLLPVPKTKKQYNSNSYTSIEHDYPGHFTSVIRYPMKP